MSAPWFIRAIHEIRDRATGEQIGWVGYDHARRAYVANGGGRTFQAKTRKAAVAELWRQSAGDRPAEGRR